MSCFSVSAAAAVLSALATIPVAFTKEHHHVRGAPQYIGSDRPNQGYVISGLAYPGSRPPVHDDTPTYDDPSKSGGNEALAVTH